MKRKIETVVLSDIHLGTVGCHALEVVEYLESIEPQHLILNGDIVDIWNFRKFYWPESHMQVIRKLFSMISDGIEVTYLTGNHNLAYFYQCHYHHLTKYHHFLLYLVEKMFSS